MNGDETKAIGFAVFIAFLLLQGVFRMIRKARNAGAGAGRAADGTGRLDRIDAAAKRILSERESGRTSVPVTQSGGIGTAAAKAKRPARTAAMTQKTGTQKKTAPQKVPHKPRAPISVRSPAVVRTGLLSGGKEPVIQRRR